MSISDTQKFFKHLDDFKNKIVNLLCELNKAEEIRRINKHYEKLLYFKNLNSRVVIEKFYEHCVRVYYNKIINKDESYFFGKISKTSTSGKEI